MSRKPLVGLGVVGTKTLIMPAPRRSTISGLGLDVMKPIAQLPRRGYSSSTTLLKVFRFWEPKVPTICFMSAVFSAILSAVDVATMVTPKGLRMALRMDI